VSLEVLKKKKRTEKLEEKKKAAGCRAGEVKVKD